MSTLISLGNDIKMLKVEAEGATKKAKTAINKKIAAKTRAYDNEFERCSAKLKAEQAEQAAKPESQDITDFTKQFVKAKLTGLTIQGKASRRLKGLTGALLTRQWAQDKENPLSFQTTKKGRKFVVEMDQDGKTAVLTTDGKAIQFPLGKGAFRSVDYVLSAYGHKYISASQRYEEGVSVI